MRPPPWWCFRARFRMLSKTSCYYWCCGNSSGAVRIFILFARSMRCLINVRDRRRSFLRKSIDFSYPKHVAIVRKTNKKWVAFHLVWNNEGTQKWPDQLLQYLIEYASTRSFIQMVRSTRKTPPSIRDCDFCSVPHLSTCLVYGDIEGLRTVDAGICMPCYMNYMEKRCGQESS